MKAVAVYLKWKLKEQFVKFHAMCLLLECWKSQSFLKRDSGIQIFLNGDVLLSES